MTENKRFYVAESNLIDGYCVFDREKKYAFTPRLRKADCLNDAHTLNELSEENEQLKQQLFEASKELLWVTSDEVDRVLYFEDELEELRKEIFE